MLEPIMARRAARCNDEMQGRRRVGVRRRPARRRARRPCCARSDGDDADDRRPVRRGQGAPRRLHDHRGARPRRGARVGPRGSREATTLPIEVRPFQRRARRVTDAADDRACLPRGVRPRGGGPGPRLRRHRRRRGGGPGRVRRRGRALARERRCRRARPAGSSPPRATARSTACAARRRATTATRRPRCCTRATSRRRGGRRARRPAAPDLHLLPPGARAAPRRSR